MQDMHVEGTEHDDRTVALVQMSCSLFTQRIEYVCAGPVETRLERLGHVVELPRESKLSSLCPLDTLVALAGSLSNRLLTALLEANVEINHPEVLVLSGIMLGRAIEEGCARHYMSEDH